MSATNTCIFIGNLTKDPVGRTIKSKATGEETRVLNFSIGTTTRRNKDKDKQETVFVDLEAWGKQAENIERLLVKGDRVQVVSEYKVDVFPHKETGENVYRSKFRVGEFEILKARAWENGPSAASEGGEVEKPKAKPAAKRKPEPEPEPQVDDADDFEDDEGLPF